MTTDTQAAGTVETRAEFNEEFVKNWLTAIEMAGKEEEPWRKNAKIALDRYAAEEGQGSKNYNILFANTQTKVPALYNSEMYPKQSRKSVPRWGTKRCCSACRAVSTRQLQPH